MDLLVNLDQMTGETAVLLPVDCIRYAKGFESCFKSTTIMFQNMLMGRFTRKRFLQTFGTSLIAPSVWTSLSSAKKASTGAPNILIMMTDDSSPFSYPAYGNTVLETPHLNGLAEQGMRFNRAYCASPQCSPARAAVLTGQMPCSVWASRLHAAVPEGVVNIVDLLNQNGYYTGAFGKTHQPVIQRDFQYYSNYADYGGKPFTAFFDQKPADKPFFLWFGSWNPHRPYGPDHVKYLHKHDPEKIKVPEFLPDTPKVRQDLAYYYDKIFQFDQNCGKLLSILDQGGWADNTIVIQTSDHGMPFPRAKATLYEPGVKVPLVIRWPRHIAPGQVSEALVSTMDLPATWLEAAGIPRPAIMQSRSFLPVLTGKKKQAREYVYVERDWHDNWDPMRTIIGERFKLIQRYRPEFPFTPSLDLQQSLSYQEIQRLHQQGDKTGCMDWYNRYIQGERPEVAFYDLQTDPGEWTNLAELANANAARTPTTQIRQFQRKLGQWMQTTGDFLPPPRTAFPGGPDSRLNKKVDPLNARPYPVDNA